MVCRLVFVAALAFTSSACGVQVHAFSVHSSMERLVRDQQEEEAPPTERRGWVRLRVQPEAEGAMFRNGDGESRRFVQVDAPEPPSEDFAEQRAHYRAFYEELRRAHRTKVVVQLTDFPEALELAVRHHLARHFEYVDTAAPDGISLRLGGGEVRHLNWNKRAMLTVVSEVATVEGEGARNTAGHLGWAIPVAMTTIGAAIVSLVMPRIHRSDFHLAVARAIDEAAARLAAGLAARCREAPIPNVCG